jgi:hypothetical protein
MDKEKVLEIGAIKRHFSLKSTDVIEKALCEFCGRRRPTRAG